MPQRRTRIYLVGLRGAPRAAFQWPLKLPPVSINAVLDPSRMAGPAAKMPLNARQQAIINNVEAHARCAGHNPDKTNLVIDIGCPAATKNYGVEISPCLTAARAMTRTFYLSRLKRTMTLSELARLQGLSLDLFNTPVTKLPKTEIGRMLGNCMTRPVLGAVIKQVVIAMKGK